MTAHVRPDQFFFPAALPGVSVALKLARECAVPSDCAALSATLQLSAIVAVRAGAAACARDLRQLSRHLDVAARVIGRPS